MRRSKNTTSIQDSSAAPWLLVFLAVRPTGAEGFLSFLERLLFGAVFPPPLTFALSVSSTMSAFSFFAAGSSAAIPLGLDLGITGSTGSIGAISSAFRFSPMSGSDLEGSGTDPGALATVSEAVAASGATSNLGALAAAGGFMVVDASSLTSSTDTGFGDSLASAADGAGVLPAVGSAAGAVTGASTGASTGAAAGGCDTGVGI